MAEKAVYTILVNSRRIEVGKEIFYAYERFRNKERYQRKQIYQTEMSLERFQEEGVRSLLTGWAGR